ncbi:unnamed protein product [Effrenium voratum]|uniref:FHA domain-containing protein n=1 Tax=Effrenium voratum TaxID=2562239 RepID=A0AA36HVU3_9DINO|nr:unnamed protein product [Effrenium voratum]
MAGDDVQIFGLLRAQGIVYQLEEAETTIGRGEECSLVLDGKGISRMHARLNFSPEPRLTDLGSGNGSFVNGARLRPHQPQALQHGDVVRIAFAKWTFSFELPRPARRPQAVETEAPKEAQEPRMPKEPKTPEKKELQEPRSETPRAPAPAPAYVLPMPYPPYPWQAQPPPPPPERPEDAEWKKDLLQRLWQLEANVSKLADANAEVCQALRSKSEERRAEKGYEDEVFQAVSALSAAADRLARQSDRSPGSPGSPPVSPPAAPEEPEWPRTVEKESIRVDSPPHEEQSPKWEIVPVEEDMLEDNFQTEDWDALIAETQRNLSLYAMLSGANEPDFESKSVSSVSSSCCKQLMFEGAIGDSSCILEAILGALEELENLGLGSSKVGNHRRWHALAEEIERLKEEEVLEREFVEKLEQEEELLRAEAFAPATAEELLLELDRMELKKKQTKEELEQLSAELKEKSRADYAMKLHSHAEEVADRLQEAENSGCDQRLAQLQRVQRLLLMDDNGFALDAYHVPKVGSEFTVPGGTMPKASEPRAPRRFPGGAAEPWFFLWAPNEAGSLFTEVKRNAKWPGPDHYKKEGKPEPESRPFGQKAALGQSAPQFRGLGLQANRTGRFSKLPREDPNGKKNWPAVGQPAS